MSTWRPITEDDIVDLSGAQGVTLGANGVVTFSLSEGGDVWSVSNVEFLIPSQLCRITPTGDAFVGMTIGPTNPWDSFYAASVCGLYTEHCAPNEIYPGPSLPAEPIVGWERSAGPIEVAADGVSFNFARVSGQFYTPQHASFVVEILGDEGEPDNCFWTDLVRAEQVCE